MESKYVGQYPSGWYEYTGTLAEIQATAGPEGSMGFCTDSPDILRYQGGQWRTPAGGGGYFAEESGTLVATMPIAVPGDGSIQGRFMGTFQDQAAIEAIVGAIPGDLATTRDGKSYVFAAVV